MRAIVQRGDRLEWVAVAAPEPGPGEVRIRTVATALNRADLAQRAGVYPPPPGASPILGLECAGFVDLVGDGVVGWAAGDPVCALLAGGGLGHKPHGALGHDYDGPGLRSGKGDESDRQDDRDDARHVRSLGSGGFDQE